MKVASIKIWATYDNQFGYVTEKLERVNSINNMQDNAMVFFRMFDHVDQMKFNRLISEETKEYISNNN